MTCFNAHDEHCALIFLVIVFFSILIASVIVIGFHPKGKAYAVRTSVSLNIEKLHPN